MSWETDFIVNLPYKHQSIKLNEVNQKKGDKQRDEINILCGI